MSNIKISSNLFLGRPELLKLQQFNQEDGYIRGLLNNSESFGLIKLQRDTTFRNAKVSSDSDINIGGVTFKTIKINDISGFDKNGHFLTSDLLSQIPIPGSTIGSASSNQWFWIRISHRYSHEEKGLWNLSADGVLTSTAGEITKILRGQPNFPSRIRFTKDTQKYGPLINTGDYDVLEITDDSNCILNGVAFEQEDNLKLNVVGTFTYGASIDPANKLIFNYDSVFVELIAETSNNTAPTVGFEAGRTFYLARVKVSGNALLIQDKRQDFWETKGSFALNDVEKSNNPLIGIESIKFDHPFTTRNHNLVEIAWAFRSSAWSINTETNTLTLSAGQGGLFKTINDFQDGDFDGWRVYTDNGLYSRISSSVRQGNAIDLQLDTLNIDSYSPDGGSSFYDSTVVVTPNAEAIEIILEPDAEANISTQTFKYEFEINEVTGKCPVLAYNDPNSFYRLSYRYRNNNIYSPEIVVIKGKYYDESSFDEKGNLLPPDQVHTYEYNGDSSEYLIRVVISPNAYKNFNVKVDKGDRIGVQNYTNVSGTSTINLIVGQTYNTLIFSGQLALTSDLTLVLDTNINRITNGNQFNIQFNATNIALNGYKINISEGSQILQSLTQGDIYMMKNITNGLAITAIYDGSAWQLRQNYDLGIPGELKEVLGLNGQSPISYFDGNGWGQVKGLFGYHLANGQANTVDLRGRFLAGYNPGDADYAYGQTGGSKMVALTAANNGPHTHTVPYKSYNIWADRGTGSSNNENWYGEKTLTATTSSSGTGTPHENRPPYYTVVFAQKMF